MRAGPTQLGERLSVLGAIFSAPPGQAHNSLWSLGSHRVTTGSQMWPHLESAAHPAGSNWPCGHSLGSMFVSPHLPEAMLFLPLSSSFLVPLSVSTPPRLPYSLAISVALPTMCLSVPPLTNQIFGLSVLFPLCLSASFPDCPLSLPQWVMGFL